MAKLISKTYGEALFELACEENKTDMLFEEAKAVLQSIKENKEFVDFLNNPKINMEEKHAVVDNIFKQFVSADLMGFIQLIIEKNRQNELISILEYFILEVKKYKKIGIVYVTTPMELDDEQKKNIADKIISTSDFVTVEMNYAVNPELLGGMVIRIGDKVLDSSIKTKLEELAKDLYKIQVE